MKENLAMQLKSLKLYEENGRYYLDAIYIRESPSEICEINVPKIKLPFTCWDYSKIVNDQTTSLYSIGEHYIETGNCIFPIEKAHKSKHINKNELPVEGVYCTIKVIEEKTKEMTIDEIERKLGHKIKIINKKE